MDGALAPGIISTLNEGVVIDLNYEPGSMDGRAGSVITEDSNCPTEVLVEGTTCNCPTAVSTSTTEQHDNQRVMYSNRRLVQRMVVFAVLASTFSGPLIRSIFTHECPSIGNIAVFVLGLITWFTALGSCEIGFLSPQAFHRMPAIHWLAIVVPWVLGLTGVFKPVPSVCKIRMAFDSGHFEAVARLMV